MALLQSLLLNLRHAWAMEYFPPQFRLPAKIMVVAIPGISLLLIVGDQLTGGTGGHAQVQLDPEGTRLARVMASEDYQAGNWQGDHLYPHEFQYTPSGLRKIQICTDRGRFRDWYRWTRKGAEFGFPQVDVGSVCTLIPQEGELQVRTCGDGVQGLERSCGSRPEIVVWDHDRGYGVAYVNPLELTFNWVGHAYVHAQGVRGHSTAGTSVIRDRDPGDTFRTLEPIPEYLQRYGGEL